jgi:hypothetical protein
LSLFKPSHLNLSFLFLSLSLFTLWIPSPMNQLGDP